METAFHMIDIGNKPMTRRLAVAAGEISVGEKAFALIRDRGLPKGDALVLAEIAGIQGAKKASEMIPLCHPMALDMARIVIELDDKLHCVRAYCIASVSARTGVEMEALAGVNASLLTVWDLTKMVEPDLRIGNIRLLLKKGGKSGLWVNPEGVPDWVSAFILCQPEPMLRGCSAAVLTFSDRAARGEYEDGSGKALQEILTQSGCHICDYRVVPDDAKAIEKAAREIIAAHAPHLLVTTGGTGVSPRDVTLEALLPLFDKTIPGVGEFLRQDGANYTPLSWSSRAAGGVIGQTLVVTLPGNPKAVQEGLAALLPNLLPHLIKVVRGER